MPNEMEYLSVGGTSYEVADGRARQELKKKIDKPSNAPQAGKTLKVLSVNEDGTFMCEWADAVTAANIQTALGYAPVKDVQVAGSSVLADGVANVPIADMNIPGVIKTGDATISGIWFENGVPKISYATDGQISSRNGQRKSIVCTNLDYAVKAAMCDGKGAAWTSAEQKAARERMGADGDYVLIESLTLTEETTYFERSSEPDGTPYDLIALKVIVKFVPGQTTGGFYFYGYNGENRITGGASQAINMSPASSPEWYRSTAIADVKPLFGLYDCTISQGSQGGPMDVTRAENGNYQLSSTDLHITKFNFHVYAANGATPCIVGTEIQIYGVRAS